MRPVAVYSALRVGLFLVTLLALRLLGVSGLLSFALAVITSLLLSFIVLRRQRDAVTLALMNRRTARPAAAPRGRRWFGDRLDADAAAEDAADDRLRGAAPTSRSTPVAPTTPTTPTPDPGPARGPGAAGAPPAGGAG